MKYNLASELFSVFRGGISKDKKAAKQEAVMVLLQKLEGDAIFKFTGADQTRKRKISANKHKRRQIR